MALFTVEKMNDDALWFLGYLQDVRTATRKEAVADTILVEDAAAVGSRFLEQYGLVTVEWDGPGRPKVYKLRDDWQARLEDIFPGLTKHGRLVLPFHSKPLWHPREARESAQKVKHD